MLIPFSINSTIAITLLGVIIPFFIFAVTLYETMGVDILPMSGRS